MLLVYKFLSNVQVPSQSYQKVVIFQGVRLSSLIMHVGCEEALDSLIISLLLYRFFFWTVRLFGSAYVHLD